MNHLVAIVGPTGIGKSRLALQLARTFDGEIVSADSRQVYCHMDIGTAKPTPEELSFVPHHLVSIVNPDENFSLAQYQKLAYQAIDNIQRRSRLPLLVGGSGLYIWSVLEGWRIPEVPPDLEFRRQLGERAERLGKDVLYQELEAVDPAAAQRIDRQNVRRVIRALEIQRHGASHRQQKQAPSYNTLIVGLTEDRQKLHRRIDLRVDSMIERGLVAEVEKLVNIGYDFSMPAMSGIGYRQIGMFIRGEVSLDVAVQKVKYETHRFVRQQYNWFRLKDDRIHWFDIQSGVEVEITGLVARFAKKG